MAIKLQQLEQTAKNYTDQRYIYKDLALDFEREFYNSPAFPTPVISNDIKASFDISAIKNSLTNLFNTLPGQRFLFPEYGLDLYQFLFQPITLSNADLIGNAIYQGIIKYETRVNVIKVNVEADPDNNRYNVTIIISIPLLAVTVEQPFVFDIKKQTFIAIPTSRNI
jgi:phage baseplate assembly protein W